MSAGESRPARPRALARTRPRIPRPRWRVLSRLDPRLARENASGWRGTGVGAGLVINKNRAAAWELYVGDSRGAPTRGLLSSPECDGEGLQEQREGEAEAERREITEHRQ